MILGVCKAFGVFSVLDGFHNLSSFPLVPSTAGPTLLAALALEGSAEIPGTERLAALFSRESHTKRASAFYHLMTEASF